MTTTGESKTGNRIDLNIVTRGNTVGISIGTGPKGYSYKSVISSDWTPEQAVAIAQDIINNASMIMKREVVLVSQNPIFQEDIS